MYPLVTEIPYRQEVISRTLHPRSTFSAEELAEGVLTHKRLALARLLTEVENDTPTGRQALNALFPHTGHAHLVGITGAPGTGKSTLVSRLAQAFRHPHREEFPLKVGILAVDPSSPFTGGAVLGDRVRMRDLSGDPGVFIRSMASRGALGGLAHTTAALVQVLDAFGFDVVIIETVGAGQSEIDIARLAQTTIVIEAPGLGDDIQAIKAGILEIADILVINKADQPGVENTERALRSMLELAHSASPRSGRQRDCLDEEDAPCWQPPILRTVATGNVGIDDLYQAVLAHSAYLRRSGEWLERDEARIETELLALIEAALVERWRQRISVSTYRETLKDLVERKISPYQAVRDLLSSAE